MKKTFTINISGTLFHIEEDAYEKLQGYFLKLKNHFGNEAEGKEIITDIEGRVAELFIEKTKGDNKIITLEMIEEVISVMGTPEDFMEQDADESYVGTPTKRKKRLYRSPDSRVLAGVCGGLGAYFKMDPVIVRIIFVLLFFANGVGLLAYLILWIAVPKARTTSQLLEMKGEEVTVSNIQRTIRDQVQENPVTMTGQEDQVTGEGTSQNFSAPQDYQSRKKESDASAEAGRAILRVIAVIFGAFFVITGALGLIGLISTVIIGQSVMGSWPLVWSPDIHVSGFFGHFITPEALTLGMISIALLTGLPLLAILFIGTKLIFRYKSNNSAVALGMVGVWLVALMVLIFVSAGQVGNYKSQTTLTNTETIVCEPCPTLFITMGEDKYSDYYEVDWDIDKFKVVNVDGENLILGQPRFDMEPSGTDDIVMVFRKKARGRNHDDAVQNINDIVYQYQVTDSLITLDPWFLTGKESKWRDQRLEIILKLPVGKTVYLDEKLEDIIFDIDNVTNTLDEDMVGKFWTMKPEGLMMQQDSVTVSAITP